MAMSWLWIVILLLALGGYILYKKARSGELRLSILSGMLSKPQSHDDRIEQLKVQTENEQVRSEELRRELEAKRELMRSRAENNRLRKELASITEQSADKDRQPPRL
jgi:cell shape-determining protein MreC